ncbi:hypothetical protein BH09GEM1_BH09GEM1_21490 [soil metagenome]
MYLGHAAVALVLKSRAPQVPIVPLTIACYGPDWIEAALMIPTPREGMSPYSHSLPALVVGAVVAAGLYALIARRPGAMMILIAWLSHWPLDLLTGLKPIVRLTPSIGLDLYHVPVADALLETVVIVIASVVYARALAPMRRQRAVVVGLAMALVTLQCTFDVVSSRLDGQPWRPSLAFEK